MSYTIQQKIGQGSQGSVYKAEWQDLEVAPRLVAVKKVPKPHTQRERDRIENEVGILSMMPKSVPLTIHLMDTYVEPTSRCIVTEFIDGEPLNMRKQNEREAKHIIRNVLRFLSICHSKRIAHRDVKPANFMIAKNGTITGIDFGMSCMTDPDGTCPGGVGTPLYMSPESIMYLNTQEDIHGFRSDIWSVGVMSYQMISGKHPYDSSNSARSEDFLPKMNEISFEDPTVSEQAWNFLRRMLSYDHEKRPSVFEALQDPWLTEDDTYKDGSFFLYLEQV